METKIDSLLSSFVFLKPLVDHPCSTEEKNKTNTTSEDEQTIHALYSFGICSVDARKNSGNEPLFEKRARAPYLSTSFSEERAWE